ncbi:Wadjet anti-phage system protein JetD domain-containing protein [Geminisphaera colitermitum]|uniref:Wadjet anti-phage system protein JetD domain-containing protein n=1 Tax=Geminisphaera colitermitum TaxID=1148786 RepID=UPI000158D08D|nr:Wadjet anti-phage system protein JetD domain-containing protein [Geminisphaera colitermitum]
MTKREQDFLTRMKRAADGRLTLELAQIQDCFFRANPDLQTHITARKQLALALKTLADAQQITLPATSTCFDRTALPPLPSFVRFPSANTAINTAPTFDHRTFPWTLPMSFIASFRNPPDATELLALNEFFRRPDAATRPLVPVKERSYEIFKNEKRLETLLDGQLGKPGRLTLDQLRCYIVPLVPVHLTFPEASGDVIIVENEATFDTIARWNRDHLQFRFVVYGRGKEAQKISHFLLHQIAHPRIRYFYFGDIDRSGILIPWNLSRTLKNEGAATLSPAGACYRMLLRQGATNPPLPDPDAGQTPVVEIGKADWKQALNWLSPDLIAPVASLLATDQRIAQEATGWEQFQHISSLV